MDKVHKQVLKDSHIFLINELIPAETLLDRLYQDNILDEQQILRLKAEVLTASCVRLLVVHMLPRLGPKAFPCFMSALEYSNQKHIYDSLMEKEKTVRFQHALDNQNTIICKWLRSHFGSSTRSMLLKDLHQLVIAKCGVYLEGRALSPTDLLELLKKVLPDVVPDDTSELDSLVLYVEVIDEQENASVATKAATNVETSAVEEKTKPMDNWTVDEVCDWLEQMGMTRGTIEQFQEENIDGCSLTVIDKETLQEMKIKIGDRLKILHRRDKLLSKQNPVELFGGSSSSDSLLCRSIESSVADVHSETALPMPENVEIGATTETAHQKEIAKNDILEAEFASYKITIPGSGFLVNLVEDALSLPPSEILRKFDTPIDVTFKYKKGAKLSCIESRPGGNLLIPIHRFVHFDLSNRRTGLLGFARESIQFICGCLNERANGTIHFGVVSESPGRLSFGGEIIGTAISGSFKDFEFFLTKALANCFPEDQIECVRQCVRSPVFIEVVPVECISFFVVELDVIARNFWCEDRAFYAKLPTSVKNHFEDISLYRIIDGTPRALKPEEVGLFMAIKGQLASDRKMQEEHAKNAGIQPVERDTDLSRKLIHLLCDGEENLHGDHYRILVINAPEEHMTEDWMKANLAFICNLEWKAIFDFDSEAHICKFVQAEEEVIKITMSDEFNPRIQNAEHLRLLHDDLEFSVHPSWVFVNGYHGSEKEPPYSPVQWKRCRADGFKEAVRFFSSKIPPGRATIVFLLFSKDTDVILEATEEFITCFPDQWMCVAETENIGKPWGEELLRRHCIETLDDRVVFGMPWNHVSETIVGIQSRKLRMACKLPTSTGTAVELKPAVKNELFDLDVVGSFECENMYSLGDQDWQEQLRKDEEVKFYRGEPASWWNFFFPNQVCHREIHPMLKKSVGNALRAKADDTLVDRVCIYHQPGAGGTTSAKNILWDFRKFFRVGIVKTITDHQTADQILKLYQYGDPRPLPLLLLLDNPEEEKANLLLGELEEMAKKLKRHDNSSQVVCVFLVCLRRTQFSKSYDLKFDPKRIVLKHELTDREKIWFKDTAKELRQQYDDTKDSGIQSVDPRLLISFNILKENFNKNFIRNMVKDFVADITDKKERKLLKYISLLNAFDLECRPLPSSAFDGLMVELPWAPGPRFGRKAISNRWENNLSSAIRVLMNETSKPAMGYIHSLRILNPLLSKEILWALATQSGGKELLSDIAVELFSQKNIFGVPSVTRDNLLRIVKDVLKQRARLPNGLTFYAPMIQHICDHESNRNAAVVLEEGYLLTDDPFVAQQLARLHYKSQDWVEAVKFAKKATDQKHDNSCLWDTFGRIYEHQLAQENDKLSAEKRKITVADSIHIINLAMNGIEMFRKVQNISAQEKNSTPNNAGLFGELQMIICLLDCLYYVDAFQSNADLRRFIVDDTYIPGNLSMLADVDGHNYLDELKKLKAKVEKVMNPIEDELIQLRVDVIADKKHKHHLALIKLKENLNVYFGEETDHPPASLEDNAQCEYRRRRIFRLAGNNLGSIFDLRRVPSGEDSLMRILDIVCYNLNTKYATANDYMTVISVSLALTSVDDKYLYEPRIRFDNLVQWSQKLYELRETMQATHLEPYLFLTMFNWPSKNRQHCITPVVIKTALRLWKDAYYKKYPRQRDESKPYRKKDTTLFFLANGSDMSSVYTMFEDHSGRKGYGNQTDTFWRQPDTLRKLQRYEGVLSGGGNEVTVKLQYSQDKESTIPIPTSFPVLNRTMWHRQVFFVIGFSWVGPKAYDITADDPTEDPAVMAKDHHVLNPSDFPRDTYFRRLQSEEITQYEFQKKLVKIDAELSSILTLKTTLRGQLLPEDVIKQENKLLSERSRLLQHRRMVMVSRIPEFP